MPQGLAAGLMQGYAKGKEIKRQRSMEDLKAEREKQQFELQKKMLDIKLANEKFKQNMLQGLSQYFGQQHERNMAHDQDKRDLFALQMKEAEKLNPMYDPSQQQAQPQQGTPMGESMVQGVPADLLSMLAIGGMAEEARALQTIKSGERLERQGNRRIDISEKSLAERKRANDLAEAGFKRGFSEWKPVTVTMPDGSEKTIAMPKFGAGGILETKPGAKNLPIVEQNLPLWRHKETLQSPPPGVTPKQAQAEGYKRLSTAQVDAVQNFAQVENILTTIEGLMEKVFPKEESALGRMIGAPQRQLSALAQTNQDAAMLMRLINGTLAPIVRSMGEKGNLSDTDIKRAAKLFPSLMDRGPVAWGMLNELKGIIERNKATKLGGMGLEVPKAKTIVRTGTYQGKKVVEYSDGSVEYAD